MRFRDKEKDAGMSPASFIPMWVEKLFVLERINRVGPGCFQ
jgi:hypothetical protein